MHTTRYWHNLHQERSNSEDWKANTPKSENSITKIYYGYLSMMEVDCLRFQGTQVHPRLLVRFMLLDPFVFCIVFCQSLLVLLSIFFGHCIVCPDSHYLFLVSSNLFLAIYFIWKCKYSSSGWWADTGQKYPPYRHLLLFLMICFFLHYIGVLLTLLVYLFLSII